MDSLEKATIAGGCFWCTEAIFQKLKGVTKVTSGYSGGRARHRYSQALAGEMEEKPPTYEEVSTGTTGFAEAIQIEFDPSKIQYETLLEIFFKLHDPTTPNQQGNDIGPQYRSAIFYHDENQKEVAEQVKKKLTDEKYFMKPIVTEITKLTNFYPAEDYHQNYFENNKEATYCRVIIDPKVRKLLSEFSEHVVEK